jgi:hypothetical protein
LSRALHEEVTFDSETTGVCTALEARSNEALPQTVEHVVVYAEDQPV